MQNLMQDLLIEDNISLDFHPKTFDDYLGQKEVKDKLAIYTQAARLRNEPLDHVLFFGPPGLGKTTLAQIMAQVLGVNIKICNGPLLERTGDLVALLSSLQKGDIFFIDEIHRMPIAVEEVLYNAMEHFSIDVIIGQGAGAQSINLPIAPFTLIGATTKSGLISAPLRSRFGIIERLEFYTPEELQLIVMQAGKYLNLDLIENAALLIAKASRGTPRIAKKILRRIRDFAQVAQKPADNQLVSDALAFLGIDSEGLNKVDNLILQTILDKFNGGPVGLETLAAIIGEDSKTIEDVYEPHLMRQGYIEKTSRGRQIPAKIVTYLKNKYKIQYNLNI